MFKLISRFLNCSFFRLIFILIQTMSTNSLSNSSDEATGMLLYKYQLPSGFSYKPLGEFDAMVIQRPVWDNSNTFISIGGAEPKKIEMQKDTLNVYFDEVYFLILYNLFFLTFCLH